MDAPTSLASLSSYTPLADLEATSTKLTLSPLLPARTAVISSNTNHFQTPTTLKRTTPFSHMQSTLQAAPSGQTSSHTFFVLSGPIHSFYTSRLKKQLNNTKARILDLFRLTFGEKFFDMTGNKTVIFCLVWIILKSLKIDYRVKLMQLV